jgi:hypothetical protein
MTRPRRNPDDAPPPPKPALDPAIAEAILAAAPKGRLDIAKSRNVIAAWLRASGYERDAWGNYHEEPGRIRWHFSTQMLQRQEKSDGEWRSRTSLPAIEAATNLLLRAAKALGRTDVLEQARGERQRRTAARTKRASAAEKDRMGREATVAAWKRIAWEHPDAMLATGLHTLPAAKGEELGALQRRYREEFQADLEAGRKLPPDSAFASASRPPLIPLFGPFRYAWVERMGDAEYSVRLERAEPGVMSVVIGTEGGFHADPVTHGMRYDHADARGDGQVTGQVQVHEGKLQAALFMLSTTKKTPLSAMRLGHLWCRLMAGWGIRRWLAQAVGEEGEAFVRAAAKRGSLKVLGARGRDMLVECRS